MGKGIASIGTKLLRGTSESDLKELVRIKEVPDLIGDPEMIETTDLQDTHETSVMGVQSSDVKSFTFNRTKENYQAVKQTENAPGYYAVVFPEGDGYVWQGQHRITQPGFGVNEAINATVAISNDTDFEYKETITEGE